MKPIENQRIIIHSAGHARAALSVADEMGVGVTLLSAPGAAAYLGAAVFRDMVAAAREEYPEVEVTAVLDCGDDPGLALGAMRHGIGAVSISNIPEIRAKLRDIANRRGVLVYEEDGPVLDLVDMTYPLAALRAWLSEPEKA
jgi:hypothetical protein